VIDTDGVPDDANEDDVPDADHIEDRHDFPDPAFDDVDPALEEPVEGEGGEEDEPELPEEDPALLEADEQIDPEEHDDVIPPGWSEE
jgi:hypothetical protein